MPSDDTEGLPDLPQGLAEEVILGAIRDSKPPDNEAPGIIVPDQRLRRSVVATVSFDTVEVFSAGIQFRLTARGVPGHRPFIPTDELVAARLGVAPATEPEVTVVLEDLGRSVAATARDWRRLVGGTQRGEYNMFALGLSGQPDSVDFLYWLTPFPQSAILLEVRWAEQEFERVDWRISREQLAAAARMTQRLW